MDRLVAQPVECEARTIAPNDLGLLDFVFPLVPEPLYLILC
jgi:hypothetical protein